MSTRTTRRRRSRTFRRTRAFLHSPWAEPNPRERWANENQRRREHERLVVDGELCAQCCHPRGLPNCPDCPADDDA